MDGFHVNAVAAAVGTFFRELPEPLLTKELYTEFLRTIGVSSRICEGIDLKWNLSHKSWF